MCVCGGGGGGAECQTFSFMENGLLQLIYVFVCVRFGLSVQVSRFLAFGSLMTGYTRQSGLHLAVAHVVGRLSVRLRRDGLTEWSIRFLYTGWP